MDIEYRNQLKISGKNASDFLGLCRGYRADYNLMGEKGMNWIVEFTFNSLVPVPTEVLTANYLESGRVWQLDNWGSLVDSELNYEPLVTKHKTSETLKLNFTTVGRDAAYWVQQVSKQFPEWTFELNSSGEAAWKNDSDISYRRFISGDVWEHTTIHCSGLSHAAYLAELFMVTIDIEQFEEIEEP
jgi:hypothetical protein